MQSKYKISKIKAISLLKNLQNIKIISSAILSKDKTKFNEDCKRLETILTEVIQEKNNLIPNKDKIPFDKNCKLEMKTVKEGSKCISLSSVAGWEDRSYPKGLCIVEIEKVMGKRPKRDNVKPKSLDISGKTKKVTCYRFKKEHKNLFPPYKNDINLNDLVKTSDEEKYKEYKIIVSNINVINKKKPIRLSIMKNNGGTLRLYYHIKNINQLEDLICSVETFDQLKKFKGQTITMRKDYSNLGGPSGEYNQEMIDWEYDNVQQIKNSIQTGLNDIEKKKKKNKKRYLGDIYINNILWRIKFNQSRQDFWLGFVLEELSVENNPCLEKTKFNTPGQDFIYTG
jgi:hypothetical protein